MYHSAGVMDMCKYQSLANVSHSVGVMDMYKYQSLGNVSQCRSHGHVQVSENKLHVLLPVWQSPTYIFYYLFENAPPVYFITCLKTPHLYILFSRWETSSTATRRVASWCLTWRTALVLTRSTRGCPRWSVKWATRPRPRMLSSVCVPIR